MPAITLVQRNINFKEKGWLSLSDLLVDFCVRLPLDDRVGQPYSDQTAPLHYCHANKPNTNTKNNLMIY